MQEEQKDIVLPDLNPLVKLYAGPADEDGHPTWTLHHPVSNRYFKLGWAEFECLARFHRCRTADELLTLVRAETTLSADVEDIQSLITFLYMNGLTAGVDVLGLSMSNRHDTPLWKKLLHHYLFFSCPLFRPQQFLDKTYKYVRPLFSKPFLTFSYGLLVFLLLLTLQRSDEFFHTFFHFFSVQGAAMIAIVFACIKIIHEFAHAYTARRYGIPVPHMGVAFIVMYPVLYTEATGMWQLSSRRERMHIGLAGVAAELVIAAYALALWHILPPGLGQSLAFAVVAISMIGSLLVNLNPLMRYDGYYVLSDATGIENLHMRAVSFARWKLRQFLFNLNDPQPEDFSEDRMNFLTCFGFALLVYRFFLYLGIAFLVGHIFFQPLGWILLGVELGWFLILPAYKEISVWYLRRKDIWAQRRGRIMLWALAMASLWLILPIQNSISVPAVVHAAQYRAAYPPVASLIVSIPIKEGQSVRKGDILMHLESPVLERDIKSAALELKSLETMKLRVQTDSALFAARRGDIDQDILAAREKLENMKERQSKLTLRAEFDGIIRDLNPDIHAGRNVNISTLLFRLIGQGKPHLTGYVESSQMARLQEGARAYFYPDYAAFSHFPAKLIRLGDVNVQSLDWPELSSLYGGPIPSEFFQNTTHTSRLAVRQSLYPVQLEIQEKHVENQDVVMRGRVLIEARAASPLWAFLRYGASVLLREGAMNGV